MLDERETKIIYRKVCILRLYLKAIVDEDARFDHQEMVEAALEIAEEMQTRIRLARSSTSDK